MGALYRGFSVNVIGNSVSWALYFVWYERMKIGIEIYRGLKTGLSYYDYLIASGAAGTIISELSFHSRDLTSGLGAMTAVCTNPIWVIKTRILSTSSSHPGAYTSISDGARQIFRSEGLSGFYRGLIPSLFGVSHGALQFMAYEQLKIYRTKSLPGGQQELSGVDLLALSGLAKIFAGSTTYPYQIVRARLQMYDAASNYKGARDVIKQVLLMEGLPGLYKGIGLNLLRVMPSTWVTFLVYEKTRVLLPQLLERSYS